MATTFEPGTRCWVPDEKEGWLGVEVTKTSNNNSKYQIALVAEDGRTFDIETNSLDESNTELPMLRNPTEAVEDLTELSYLNEPSVLNAIKVRYSQFEIYTYSGIVLIAANPFERNDELYSPHRIERYAGKRRGEEEPHLFAIAEDAYRCMKTDGKNQSIVVSGESGAGKTVSAKYIMRYMASVESDGDHEMSEVEKQILATNPIMEAFGNAKTTRNDNSSRFGKYLEILFDKNTVITGARIRTYLLERSRLVFQPKTERNYHIFYQVMEGLDAASKEKFGLTKTEDFHYLNQGGVPRIEGVDDAKEFKDTSDALKLIGVNEETQLQIYKMLAALLHLGNIDIKKTRNDAFLSADEPSLVKACELLGLEPNSFSKWIVKKQITTRSEKIVSNLNYQQAIVARDSVAKYIYSSLFDWLVEYVNSDLCPPHVEENIKSFIGVLDIYGFEHFDVNSFEQFCINYANEKLQQEFNQHVFKLEQEEYIREQIEWSFIEFSDNQPCISLIENKLGILSLLDEESRLPAGSDQSWADKMFQTLAKPPTDKCFKKPRFGNNKFIVAHYALDVPYDVDGFIEKNRDTVSEGHLEVLAATTDPLLKGVLATVEKAAEKVAAEQAANAATRPGRKVVNRKPTLGSIFKASLVELMETINSTNVHYIRCIKPNEEKKAWEFDPVMVLSQLRACGVLETIKISCAGYPSRSPYAEFAQAYGVLLHSDLWHKFVKGFPSEQDAKDLCQKILAASIDDPMKYQLGSTKIFFKAGILAYLEKLRSQKLHRSAVMVQKYVKGANARRRYRETLAALIATQSLVRGFLTRARVTKERQLRAATMLQTISRGYLARRRVSTALIAVTKVQAAVRGHQTRLNVMRQRHEGAAKSIQTAWRTYSARRAYANKMHSVVLIQSLIRRKRAIAELKQLKVESKSVDHMKKLQYNLENKIIDLTQQLTTKNDSIKSLVSEIESLRLLAEEGKQHQETVKQKEIEHQKSLEGVHATHQEKVSGLTAELEQARTEQEEAQARITALLEEKESLKIEIESHKKELEKVKQLAQDKDVTNRELNVTVDKLKSELEELTKQIQSGRVASLGPSAASRGIANGGSPNIPWGTAPETYNARPVSFNGSQVSETVNAEAIETELWNSYRDSKALHKEVIDGLLKNLKLPPATVALELTKKEVLFPARIIIIILSDMWRLGLTGESEKFLGEVLSAIQNVVGSLKEDDIITHGAFWLTNTHELYSFICYAQSTIVGDESTASAMSETEYEEYLQLIAVIKEDFESLSYNIYNMWMKRMQKMLEKRCISAVVLTQSLPGFTAPDNLMQKVFSSSSQYTMDDILTFFNHVYWSMKAYFIEPSVINEVIIELLKFVDAYCFNDLIMRRSFLSWKRGLQINYNVTRLEEWCKGHDIREGSTYLAHLLQVAKLLQLRKNTPDDIEIIYEICYALKPNQIQKVVSNYYIADYETPIPPAVLKAVVDKVKQQGGNATQYLEPVNTGSFDDPFRKIDMRPFTNVEAYVPSFLNVPLIRRIIELVSKNASVQQAAEEPTVVSSNDETAIAAN